MAKINQLNFVEIFETIICTRVRFAPSPHFKNQLALSERFLLCGDEQTNCFVCARESKATAYRVAMRGGVANTLYF